ncbi:hypothetical protein ACNHKA_06610 [Klebsiella michiganensis]
MANFKAGDTVVHASGFGPTMVVHGAFKGFDIEENSVDMCECEYWSAKEDKFVRERFPQTSLQKAPEGGVW